MTPYWNPFGDSSRSPNQPERILNLFDSNHWPIHGTTPNTLEDLKSIWTITFDPFDPWHHTKCFRHAKQSLMDRKTYPIELDDRYKGTRIKISEITRDKAFFLSLKWDSFHWLQTSYKVLLSAPLNQKNFKEKRFPEQTIWIEKLTNKKGTMPEISLLHGNGGLNKLFVPTGEDRKGWIAFFNIIGNYSLLSTKISDHQLNSRR